MKFGHGRSRGWGWDWGWVWLVAAWVWVSSGEGLSQTPKYEAGEGAFMGGGDRAEAGRYGIVGGIGSLGGAATGGEGRWQVRSGQVGWWNESPRIRVHPTWFIGNREDEARLHWTVVDEDGALEELQVDLEIGHELVIPPGAWRWEVSGRDRWLVVQVAGTQSGETLLRLRVRDGQGALALAEVRVVVTRRLPWQVRVAPEGLWWRLEVAPGRYEVEWSSQWQDWTPLFLGDVSEGGLEFLETEFHGDVHRFYRIRSR